MTRRSQKERRAAKQTAAKQQPDSKPDSKPESQITCCICMQPVKDPTDLECKHSLCTDCFITWDVMKMKETSLFDEASDSMQDVKLRLEMPFRNDAISSIGHIILTMNGQGLVPCPLCNVTYSALSPENYNFLKVYRRVLAKIHFAKVDGHSVMHYIFDPFEIFHYLPKVKTNMYIKAMFKLTMDVMLHSKRSSEPLDLHATQWIDTIDEDGIAKGLVVLFRAEELPEAAPPFDYKRLKDTVKSYSEINPYLRSLNLV